MSLCNYFASRESPTIFAQLFAIFQAVKRSPVQDYSNSLNYPPIAAQNALTCFATALSCFLGQD